MATRRCQQYGLWQEITPFRLPKKLRKIAWLSTASHTAEYSIHCAHPCVALRIAMRGWVGQWLLVWRVQPADVYDTGTFNVPCTDVYGVVWWVNDSLCVLARRCSRV